MTIQTNQSVLQKSPNYLITTAEVLALKYNKAVLICSIWTQRGKNINLELPPNDSVSLDLKEDLELPRGLELTASVKDHQIKITLEITRFSHYGLLNHTDSDGNQVVAKYSPFLKMNYSSSSNTSFGKGLSMSGSGSAVRTVYERIEDLALKEIINAELVEQNGVTIDKGAFNDYVNCIIQTDIKPEYADQFSFTPAK